MIFLKVSQGKGIQAEINERQHPDSQRKLTQRTMGDTFVLSNDIFHNYLTWRQK